MNYRKQCGASLVEVMVGLFVGLLVLITVYESFAFLEASKRTTVSSNSAFANLISGMHVIDHDIKMAGLGTGVKDFNICQAWNGFYDGSVVANSAVLAPVEIQSGGGAPDQLSTFYGNAITGGAPTQLLTAMGTATAPLSVNTSTDLQIGQLALLMAPAAATPCTLVEVTDVQNMGNYTQVSHASSGTLFNPPNPDASYTNSVRYSEDAVVLNLGALTWQTWRVQNGQLQLLNRFTNTTSDMVSHIVHLRAQYGVTNGISNTISEWVDATGEWTPLDSAHSLRVRAIRLALVARSPKREKPTVSGGVCDATITAPRPWLGEASVDLSADPNWQCYRYRVLKTVMPLKNRVWSTTT